VEQMTEKKYASLHAHSDYSNLKVIDSINKVKDLIDGAYNKGLHAIALTDHDTISGHVKAIQHFRSKYLETPFKLILGNEIYLTREGLNSTNYEKGEKFYHVLLLAKDAVGHEQIRKLSSRAWSRSFIRGVMRTPTYGSDLKEVVGANPGHLITTTACLGGVTGSLFTSYGAAALEDIAAHLEKMEALFGKGNFFIEVQPSSDEQQIAYNKFMVESFWGTYPFVFTTDAHYLNEEDKDLHAQFLNSASNGDRDAENFYASAFVMTTEQVFERLSYLGEDKLEEMRLNTIRIADSVETYDLKHPQVVPTVPVTINKEDELYLKELSARIADKYNYIHEYLNTKEIQDRYFILKIFKGFEEKINEWTEEYMQRFNDELEQVWETSVTIKQPLSKYFVTMAKMIDIMWNEGDSLVGVSRGSAAGFLLNYCLGITQLDPLRQELIMPYWRFIHKDRPELPDIDIDTEGSKRTRVFNKVQEYFNSIGGDLINVCTFGTEKSKSAIRTAGRALNVDDDIISFIVSLVPNERGFDWTLDQCMYGDEDHKAIPKFQEEMGREKSLWKLAYSIEGLITRLGVHASGVIAFNEDFTKHNSLMKTSRGVLVSAYNLEDTEYAGGLKYDFLTINALDKIRTTMNLLLEDRLIVWQGNLKATYDKYLLPKELEYKDSHMWDKAGRGEIVDLFQFDTSVGYQAMQLIKPQSISQLAIANSLMRLMAQDDNAELPLNTYVKFKNSERMWYDEMKNAGLNSDEIAVLEKYLKPLSGVADSQESVMMMVMDPKITGFSVVEANGLRKAIAKKKFDTIDKIKKMFYEKGKQLGSRTRLLDYVWEVQVMRQAGYSFSVLHTMGYSTIALQEMNLAYKYPTIYWNTACLSVNAGAVNEEDYEDLVEEGIVEIEEEDDNKREGGKVQYGKVAAAISKFRTDLGVKIELPDVNRAKFGFTPDFDDNVIWFGLKGITRIGDDLIREIIANRPYTSVDNFIDKLNKTGARTLVSKDRVIMLIKAGAFDKVEMRPREEIMKDYILKIYDKKTRVTLQNVMSLIKLDLLPESLSFEKKIFNFTKYIRKSKLKEYYVLDEVAQEFYFENNLGLDIENVKRGVEIVIAINAEQWEKIYDKHMEKVRDYIVANQEELLNAYNHKAFEEEWNKYAAGNVLQWELEALNFYHSGHELEGIAKTMFYDITPVDKLPDNEVVGVFDIDGKTFPKYRIRHIIGTVLDKDKLKHTVTLSSPEGIITIKIYRSQFSKYDQVLSTVSDDGAKNLIQDSFFKKGTHLMVTGIKRGDTFVPKVYKGIDAKPILMFEIEDGKFKQFHEKL
jgi:DNA polymerase-3 subunit alpha